MRWGLKVYRFFMLNYLYFENKIVHGSEFVQCFCLIYLLLSCNHFRSLVEFSWFWCFMNCLFWVMLYWYLLWIHVYYSWTSNDYEFREKWAIKCNDFTVYILVSFYIYMMERHSYCYNFFFDLCMIVFNM